MYSPFEFNDLLGPLLAAKLVSAALFVTIVTAVYSAYLQKQEDDIS